MDLLKNKGGDNYKKDGSAPTTPANQNEQGRAEATPNGTEEAAGGVELTRKMQEAKEMTLKTILTQEAIDRSRQFRPGS